MEEKNENCAYKILHHLDTFWKEYKHHSGKISIVLSILGGLSSILVGMDIIAGSIALAITNISIFMSGVAYEKLAGENDKLHTDCQSQKQMLRRMTMVQNNPFNLPSDNDDNTPQSIESIQPVHFESIHRNNHTAINVDNE